MGKAVGAVGEGAAVCVLPHRRKGCLVSKLWATCFWLACHHCNIRVNNQGGEGASAAALHHASPCLFDNCTFPKQRNFTKVTWNLRQCTCSPAVLYFASSTFTKCTFNNEIKHKTPTCCRKSS